MLTRRIVIGVTSGVLAVTPLVASGSLSAAAPAPPVRRLPVRQRPLRQRPLERRPR